MKVLLVASLLTVGFAVQAANPGPGNESSMTGAELRVCDSSKRKCLMIRSAKTEGSQLQAIHKLKKPVVVFTDSKTKKEECVEGSTGYLDLENHQVVIYENRGQRLTEVSFDLNSLRRRDLKIR